MKAYLAARYSRHPEMRACRSDLAGLGITVDARWIDGLHEKVDGVTTHEQSQRFATDDINDLMAADIVISFTENPAVRAEGRARGGRHVEFGIALATGKRVIVVGHRENVFHHLPVVEFYETWAKCLLGLAAEAVAL